MTTTTQSDLPDFAVLAPTGQVYGPMSYRTAHAFANGLDTEIDEDGERSCNHLVLAFEVAARIGSAVVA